ncbi:hypothetical protein [Saccharopolyspora gloriosae]|uniref:hypothetical protein n=1 Tax=Saccharopolyspora gloriosae TaxID=455344 RepID=UPI001FB5D1EA|nr:hypothetical protein [Saccharopolyspora gloriosae]
MRTKQIRMAAACAASIFLLVGVSATANAGTSSVVLEPPPRCDDFVYVTPFDDVEGDAWSARIVGVDLPRLVNGTAATVHIDPQDAFPDRPYDIHVDASHPLNVSQGLKGPTADIHVAVMSLDGSYVGCSSVYHLTVPPPA